MCITESLHTENDNNEEISQRFEIDISHEKVLKYVTPAEKRYMNRKHFNFPKDIYEH